VIYFSRGLLWFAKAWPYLTVAALVILAALPLAIGAVLAVLHG